MDTSLLTKEIFFEILLNPEIFNYFSKKTNDTNKWLRNIQVGRRKDAKKISDRMFDLISELDVKFINSSCSKNFTKKQVSGVVKEISLNVDEIDLNFEDFSNNFVVSRNKDKIILNFWR